MQEKECPMTTHRTVASVTRRTALAGLGAGGLGVALAAAARPAAAQDAAMANHPMVGTWMGGRAPNDLGITHWGPDGNMTLNGGPVVGKGPDGALTYNDTNMGSWVPVSARGIRFFFTQRVYDAAGALLGYGSVEGYPVASEDGMSFWDDGTQVVLTFRDPNGVVIDVQGPGLQGAGIGGVRLVPGESGYDEMLAMLAAQQTATPEASTPTT
jgi:hypothetical protein